MSRTSILRARLLRWEGNKRGWEGVSLAAEQKKLLRLDAASPLQGYLKVIPLLRVDADSKKLRKVALILSLLKVRNPFAEKASQVVQTALLATM